MAVSEAELAQAAEALREASSVFVVTGAGVSVDSGLPTFRGPGGLWEGFRAEELATPEAFRADPARVWRWYRWRWGQYRHCAPNPAHEVIAAMESAYEDFLLATQNVDALHRRAGSRRLVELHGTLARMRCSACEALAPFPDEPAGDDPVPRCQPCGEPMRPHVLWFGETYWPGVMEEAEAAARRADVVLVAGTSGAVWAPAALALAGKRAGALLVDINPEASELSRAADVHLAGGAADVLTGLWSRVTAMGTSPP